MLIVIHRIDVGSTLDEIRDFFLRVYGWDHVYHDLVFLDRVESWCPLHKRGKHAAPYNTGSRGVGIVGDFRKNICPPSQWDLAVGLCADALNEKGLWPHTVLYRGGNPYHRLSGHGELPGVSKDCPGRLFDMRLFRGDVRDRVG